MWRRENGEKGLELLRAESDGYAVFLRAPHLAADLGVELLPEHT